MGWVAAAGGRHGADTDAGTGSSSCSDAGEAETATLAAGPGWGPGGLVTPGALVYAALLYHWQARPTPISTSLLIPIATDPTHLPATIPTLTPTPTPHLT
jgi:hypothetical protein